MFLAHNLHFIVQEMYATRTILIIEQQVFESTDDIIYFSYYHDYILCFFISLWDYAFFYFQNNRKNFAHLFNGSSKQPLGFV
jgi:hypothetical protein